MAAAALLAVGLARSDTTFWAEQVTDLFAMREYILCWFASDMFLNKILRFETPPVSRDPLIPHSHSHLKCIMPAL